MDKILLRKIVIWLYIILFVLGVSYYLLITYTPVEFPCSYYTLTGKMCGGCGTTRMVLNLLKGDFIAAYSYNPLSFLTLCFWFIVSLGLLTTKPSFFRNGYFLSISGIVTISAFIIFTVIRSLC